VTPDAPGPVRVEICGLLLAVSLTCTFPVLGPAAVGTKTTWIVHVLFAAKLVPQVVANTAKSPLVETAILFSVTLWLLVKVNVFGKLVEPTVCVR